MDLAHFMLRGLCNDLKRWMNFFRKTIGLTWLLWNFSSSSHESENCLPHIALVCVTVKEGLIVQAHLILKLYLLYVVV